MRKELFLPFFFIFLSLTSVAQESGSTVGEDSGAFSFFPEVEINSVDRPTNTTGEASSGQTSFFWIIFLGLTFIGVVIYSFEIDPVWMVGFIAVSGIVLLHLRTGFLPI